MCGVIGVLGPPGSRAADLLYLGLYALQHRGEESCGMAVSDGGRVHLGKGMGLVPDVFNRERLAELPGPMGIGHVRYSTTGASYAVNAQPLLAYTSRGPVAVAHNGDLVNARELRVQLQRAGSVFQTTTDSEVILNLFARFGDDDPDTAAMRTMAAIRGGYAVVMLTRDRLLAFRDPYGIRPLCWGRAGDAFIIASESCALTALGVDEVHEVLPGELLSVDAGGVRRRRLPAAADDRAPCAFEYIYFSRPDSELLERNVHLVRKAIGRRLYEERPVEADVVIAAPDSGTSAAMGFAEAAGIPFEIGLVKNRYVGRTFIHPEEGMRHLAVKVKLNPNRQVLKGKRVVVLDDSIVRGTTSRRTVALVREAGAREVHMYVAAPPFLYPCYYGVDISSRKELIAAQRILEEIRDFIGADSLYYLSVEGLCQAVGVRPEGLCLACMTGVYPEPVPEEDVAHKHALEGIEHCG
ncbi:MAG: amidophosphoribosyltransferase [Firmicutes bacterium ZCTH02-B6]|nr:MAG: amidophosphoribosyltransferase [Firmicutes bacterium ZCTH02-B6]